MSHFELSSAYEATLLPHRRLTLELPKHQAKFCESLGMLELSFHLGEAAGSFLRSGERDNVCLQLLPHSVLGTDHVLRHNHVF